MSVRRIRLFPDDCLTEPCEPVEDVESEVVQSLIDDMLETVHEYEGLGLAANQIGESKRIIVLRADPLPDEMLSSDLVLVNPTLQWESGAQTNREGCLSFPGASADIERSEYIEVEAQDREGVTMVQEATGYLASAYQHEIDHLDGTLMIDHLGDLERKLFLKDFRKSRKQIKRVQRQSRRDA